jgi:hypothetical protein
MRVLRGLVVTLGVEAVPLVRELRYGGQDSPVQRCASLGFWR